MKNAKKETLFKGLPISGGIAVYKVCLFNDDRHNNLPSYHIKNAELEKFRLKEAMMNVSDKLDIIKKEVSQRIGPAEAEIFTAQKMILEDVSLHKKFNDAIDSGSVNAEPVVSAIMDEYEAKLLQVESEYIRERASDISEVKQRILDALRNTRPALACEGNNKCARGKNRIIIARELTPSLTLDLDTENIKGFVTERGGITSHAAILARSAGIPAVSGIKDIYDHVSCSTEVLVNGYTGEVIVWPKQETIERMLYSEPGGIGNKTEIILPLPELKVFANINLSADVSDAINMNAEGIGLYRTEFEFLAAGKMLDENEQYERYVTVLKQMGDKPVYFRILDIGGDKTSEFFNIPSEENPSLGCRGGRLLLSRPDLLKTQARALARASMIAPVYVMYPMITSLNQFLKLKKIFVDAASDIMQGTIYHGIMFEVPSACLQAPDLYKHIDFASIGTNDLIQFLFAVDRNNDLVAYDYDPDSPVFWMILSNLAQTAKSVQKPISVCGEVAGDPKFVPKLIQIGIKTVSVSSRLIHQVRDCAVKMKFQ